MEFDLGRLKNSFLKIKDSLSPLTTSPTPEFEDFIGQLNAGLPEDHPFYGIPTGGYLNTEGTYKKNKDGSESGWYEIHPDGSPSFYAYQVLKSPEGEFSMSTSFGVDPRMKNNR